MELVGGDDMRSMAAESAGLVVPHVVKLLQPASVVDVGCDSGEWLAAFARCGVRDLVGVDSSIPAERATAAAFLECDLTRPLAMARTFDLAVSLEVAEHLPRERAASFVGDLCALSSRVLFSAAIPGQGGTHHVNEQWQSYWATLFAEHGFAAHDVVRGAFWDDERVGRYYRQNMLLYERDTPADVGMLDVVHPGQLSATIATLPASLTTRQLLRLGPGALVRSVRHRLHRLRRVATELDDERT